MTTSKYGFRIVIGSVTYLWPCVYVCQSVSWLACWLVSWSCHNFINGQEVALPISLLEFGVLVAYFLWYLVGIAYAWSGTGWGCCLSCGRGECAGTGWGCCAWLKTSKYGLRIVIGSVTFLWPCVFICTSVSWLVSWSSHYVIKGREITFPFLLWEHLLSMMSFYCRFYLTGGGGANPTQGKSYLEPD